MSCTWFERRMDGYEVGFSEQPVQWDINQVVFAFFALGHPSRSPIEQAHREAPRPPGDCAANTAGAADQADGLAPDESAFESHRLRAGEYTVSQQAITFHHPASHGKQQPEV